MKREREREREKLETDNKEEERCNKLDRRERSCFSITTKKHITKHREKYLNSPFSRYYKRHSSLHYINVNNNNNNNTFKNVLRSSKAHHDLLFLVRNNKRGEKSAETIGKRNNSPIYY